MTSQRKNVHSSITLIDHWIWYTIIMCRDMTPLSFSEWAACEVIEYQGIALSLGNQTWAVLMTNNTKHAMSIKEWHCNRSSPH